MLTFQNERGAFWCDIDGNCRGMQPMLLPEKTLKSTSRNPEKVDDNRTLSIPWI